jgi:hypothetical protein
MSATSEPSRGSRSCPVHEEDESIESGEGSPEPAVRLPCAPALQTRIAGPEEYRCAGKSEQWQRRSRCALPSEVLRKTREDESVDHRADIARRRKAEDEALHARRIGAAGHRQCDREAGARHAEERA